ncbi:hypothetical protein PENTCL1PPCAC_29386, partial [Pristionchus entomophagus]
SFPHVRCASIACLISRITPNRMPRCHNVLDSDSDSEIGWSRTLDLPRSRQSRKIEELVRTAAQATANEPGTSKGLRTSTSRLFLGPAAKRIKLEVREVEDTETEDDKRRNIANWPGDLLNHLIDYLPIDDRIKMRCTCRRLRDIVDNQEMMHTYEIYIKRLDEAEIGLFLPVSRKEGRFVIHNKKFTWKERPLLRTIPEMRRGMVNWTRHHRTRMGRIRTAIKAMFRISMIYRINVEQVNLSNSFIRDLIRVMNGNEIHSLDLSVQMFEQERPDLTLLNNVPAKSIALSVRLKDREPLPHIERFLNISIHTFKQIIIDVRQDSWKFKSSLHYRKSYEEYGINDAALMHYMSGDVCNFLRLKVICRYITKEGVLSAILHLRTREDTEASRGFCVLVHRQVTDNLIANVKSLSQFGDELPTTDAAKTNYDGHRSYHTVGEYLEIRNIKQDMTKDKPPPPLSEVRYFRKGSDEKEKYMTCRVDDDIRWDPFEQPKFQHRPV